MISLFLIIGQISASDSDLIETDALNTSDVSIELTDCDFDVNSDNNMNKDTQFNVETDDSSRDDDIDEDINGLNDKDIDDEEIREKDMAEKNIDFLVMTNDSYSCGPASLANALNKYGLNLSLNEVSQHTNTSLNGTTMQSLIDAARYYNLSAYGVEIETEFLKENCLVHLNVNGLEHWTVVRKLTDTHVFLADSAAGYINLTIGEFNSYFTKKAIILSNANIIDLKVQTISSQIKILDKEKCLSISGKGLKRKIVGYRTVWKYGWRQKYGWILRPVVSGGHVCFTQWKYVKGYYAVWGKYKAKEPILLCFR